MGKEKASEKPSKGLAKSQRVEQPLEVGSGNSAIEGRIKNQRKRKKGTLAILASRQKKVILVHQRNDSPKCFGGEEPRKVHERPVSGRTNGKIISHEHIVRLPKKPPPKPKKKRRKP